MGSHPSPQSAMRAAARSVGAAPTQTGSRSCAGCGAHQMPSKLTVSDEMLGRANSLPFGLASYAFTKNSKTAAKVADALESGMVTINHFGLALPETPFGGVKDSGFGHEGGAEGLTVYMQAKFVSQLG
jgi:hypothetical protein